MNNHNKHDHSIIGGLLRIADDMQPLTEMKNPKTAAFCGFFGGGIALGLYLKSWKDFLIPSAMLFLFLFFGVITGELLLLLAPFAWAAYGYRRTKTSNTKLSQAALIPVVFSAEEIAARPALMNITKG